MAEEEQLALDPRAEERVGSVLADKWTLESLIGLGGMGAVYAAKHRNGARAAVKILHPELARNSEVRERFRRECYAANTVDHRSTVKVLDDDIIKDGPDEGAAYLVMELLEGESLDTRADREPRLDEREVLEILDTVLGVLEAAHEKGIVHRDIKPDNLFLAKDPDSDATRLKVLDFGLARIAEAARVTGHGLALGTPAFMSPEQAAGLPEIDGRADLFSLAATAFYCLTGQHVHEAETVLQQIIKMAKDPAPPLKSVLPRASDDVAAIIDRALQVDRDMRYENAAAMHADVKAALDARMANDKRRTLITAVSIPPDALRDTAELPAVQPKEEKEEKKGSGFPIFFFLLLALAGLGWIFWPKIKARFLHEVRPDVTAPPVEVSAQPSASASAPAADAASDLDAGSSAAADLDEAGAADAATDAGDDDDEFEEEDASAAAAPSASTSSSAKTPGKTPPKKRKKKPKHPRK